MPAPMRSECCESPIIGLSDMPLRHCEVSGLLATEPPFASYDTSLGSRKYTFTVPATTSPGPSPSVTSEALFMPSSLSCCVSALSGATVHVASASPRTFPE